MKTYIYFVAALVVVGGLWQIVSHTRIEKICGTLTFEDGSSKPDCWIEIGKY